MCVAAWGRRGQSWLGRCNAERKEYGSGKRGPGSQEKTLAVTVDSSWKTSVQRVGTEEKATGQGLQGMQEKIMLEISQHARAEPGPARCVLSQSPWRTGRAELWDQGWAGMRGWKNFSLRKS